MIFFICLVLCTPLMECSGLVSDNIPKIINYKIVNTYPHKPGSFTQGFTFADGFLYEGTGHYGTSTLRKVMLDTGEIVQIFKLPRDVFGEGITIYKNKIIQLSWLSRVGFVYNKESFKQLGVFNYPVPIEGWGITFDGKSLIMSDGTHKLYFLDPESFVLKNQLEVYDNEGPVRKINELEYVEGTIYANVWQSAQIIRIDPGSGRVIGIIDLKNIVPEEYKGHMDYVLNGIAYDSKTKHLFVTGKMWPQIFEIELQH